MNEVDSQYERYSLSLSFFQSSLIKKPKHLFLSPLFASLYSISLPHLSLSLSLSLSFILIFFLFLSFPTIFSLFLSLNFFRKSHSPLRLSRSHFTPTLIQISSSSSSNEEEKKERVGTETERKRERERERDGTKKPVEIG